MTEQNTTSSQPDAVPPAKRPLFGRRPVERGGTGPAHLPSSNAVQDSLNSLKPRRGSIVTHRSEDFPADDFLFSAAFIQAAFPVPWTAYILCAVLADGDGDGNGKHIFMGPPPSKLLEAKLSGDVSVRSSLAEALGIKSRSTDCMLHVLPLLTPTRTLAEAVIGAVELSVRDEYLSRADSFRIQHEMHGRCVCVGQSLVVQDVRLGVRSLTSPSGAPLVSGCLTSTTRMSFRSRSSHLYAILHVSPELWAGPSAPIPLESFLDRLLPSLATAVSRVPGGCNHKLTLVFYARATFPGCAAVNSSFNVSGIAVQAPKDITDSTIVFLSSAKEEELNSMALKVRKALMRFLQKLPCPTPWTPQPSDCVLPGVLAVASEGRPLAVVAMAVSSFDRHNFNRDFTTTGQVVTLVTAGTPMFPEEYSLINSLWAKVSYAGINVEVLVLGRPPTHAAPLIELSSADVLACTNDIEGLDPDNVVYVAPPWIGVRYFCTGADTRKSSLIGPELACSESVSRGPTSLLWNQCCPSATKIDAISESPTASAAEMRYVEQKLRGCNTAAPIPNGIFGGPAFVPQLQVRHASHVGEGGESSVKSTKWSESFDVLRIAEPFPADLRVEGSNVAVESCSCSKCVSRPTQRDTNMLLGSLIHYPLHASHTKSCLVGANTSEPPSRGASLSEDLDGLVTPGRPPCEDESAEIKPPPNPRPRAPRPVPRRRGVSSRPAALSIALPAPTPAPPATSTESSHRASFSVGATFARYQNVPEPSGPNYTTFRSRGTFLVSQIPRPYYLPIALFGAEVSRARSRQFRRWLAKESAEIARTARPSDSKATIGCALPLIPLSCPFVNHAKGDMTTFPPHEVLHPAILTRESRWDQFSPVSFVRHSHDDLYLPWQFFLEPRLLPLQTTFWPDSGLLERFGYASYHYTVSSLPDSKAATRIVSNLVIQRIHQGYQIVTPQAPSFEHQHCSDQSKVASSGTAQEATALEFFKIFSPLSSNATIYDTRAMLGPGPKKKPEVQSRPSGGLSSAAEAQLRSLALKSAGQHSFDLVAGAQFQRITLDYDGHLYTVSVRIYASNPPRYRGPTTGGMCFSPFMCSSLTKKLHHTPRFLFAADGDEVETQDIVRSVRRRRPSKVSLGGINIPDPLRCMFSRKLVSSCNVESSHLFQATDRDVLSFVDDADAQKIACVSSGTLHDSAVSGDSGGGIQWNHFDTLIASGSIGEEDDEAQIRTGSFRYRHARFVLLYPFAMPHVNNMHHVTSPATAFSVMHSTAPTEAASVPLTKLPSKSDDLDRDVEYLPINDTSLLAAARAGEDFLEAFASFKNMRVLRQPQVKRPVGAQILLKRAAAMNSQSQGAISSSTKGESVDPLSVPDLRFASSPSDLQLCDKSAADGALLTANVLPCVALPLLSLPDPKMASQFHENACYGWEVVVRGPRAAARRVLGLVAASTGPARLLSAPHSAPMERTPTSFPESAMFESPLTSNGNMPSLIEPLPSESGSVFNSFGPAPSVVPATQCARCFHLPSCLAGPVLDRAACGGLLPLVPQEISDGTCCRLQPWHDAWAGDDPRHKHWFDVILGREWHPTCAFFFELRWGVCPGTLTEDLAASLRRKATALGLKIFRVPTDISPILADPFEHSQVAVISFYRHAGGDSSIRLPQIIVSPLHYLLNWMISHNGGFYSDSRAILPGTTLVHRSETAIATVTADGVVWRSNTKPAPSPGHAITLSAEVFEQTASVAQSACDVCDCMEQILAAVFEKIQAKTQQDQNGSSTAEVVPSS